MSGEKTIAWHVRGILQALNLDLTSEGLKGTPDRVERAWRDMTRGYGMDPARLLGVTFPAEGYDQMITLAGGEFLDPCKTWRWKGAQVEHLARLFQDGSIKDGDVILSLDGWGPGTTAAAYMRDAMRLDVKIVLFMHAGTYDPHDFLTRADMERWAAGIEYGWFQAADLILVGSEFHTRLLIETRGAEERKIAATGYPILPSALPFLAEPWETRPPLVVFPHRLAPEKAPWEFERMREIFEASYDYPAEWVMTRDSKWVGTEFDGYSSKRAYYSLLSRARVVVSTARQETFGIAMQEGIALGAWAVAPARLSYAELIDSSCGLKYRSLEEAAEFVRMALNNSHGSAWSGWHEKAIQRAADEIKGRFAR